MKTTQTTPVITEESTSASEDSFFRRLYTGEGGIEIVGKRKRWYQIAAGVIIVAVLSMLIRGFSLGIDFEGGTKMTMPPASVTTEQAEKVFTDATGVTPEMVQIIGSGEGRILEITSEKLTQDEINQARIALDDAFKPVNEQGEQTPDAIGDSTVSESWGSSITNRMLVAAVVFLALVFAYITIRFERDMAIAAILSLLVDAVVIMGIYALIGFDVTPATVIGLLTVLSFSLYDTVVVFDKVDENTAGYRSSTRRTYSELVNLAVNQTIMRSINTTVSTMLPILALMIIAVGMLGVGTLKDLALVQLIGIVQGTFSSIFLAAPLLVSLKSRQRDYRKHDEAVLEARAQGSAKVSVAAESTDEDGVAVDPSASDIEQSATPKRTVSTPKPPSEGGDDGMPLSWRPGQ
ncbi:MAG: protein translocase subunit SecF [Corynebacterium sp.]|uniref:protein translocase subunit SecF n=1 Tax=Corynebacterium sp. TaxID=1720 RepID=UPI0026DC5512|nr:protein translocase subunit SecF [Corynebacterium sp.]MDO5029151.1 protein translocase subunit SecF [Corynebacterium sp.]